MRAGTLRKRIVIQQPTTVHDSAFGAELSATWANVATVSASIDDIQAASWREQDIAKTIASTVSHVVKMRFTAAVKEKYRLQYGSRFFHVNGVTDTRERGRESVCYCTELKAPAVSQ